MRRTFGKQYRDLPTLVLGINIGALQEIFILGSTSLSVSASTIPYNIYRIGASGPFDPYGRNAVARLHVYRAEMRRVG